MPDNITSTVRLFADDTIAYLTVSSDTNTMQEYLNKLAKLDIPSRQMRSTYYQ